MRTAVLGVLLVCLVGLSAQAQTSKPPADELWREYVTAFNQPDYAKAEFWGRELRANYPLDDRWGPGLTSVLDAQGKTAEALKIAREIQPRYAKAPDHFLRVGVYLLKLDRAQEALGEFQTALRLSTTPTMTVAAYNQIGSAYRELEQLDDAIVAFRKAKELSGKPSIQLALTLGMKGHGDEEIAEYRAVLRETPLEPVALNNLAYAWAERNEHLDEALTYSRIAVDATRGSAVMSDTLGWIYFKKGMLEEAETTMVEALLQEGGNQPTLLQHLAAVLDARGQWNEERKELRALLETASRPGEIARLKLLLRKVQPR